jgi:hypothetical protein
VIETVQVVFAAPGGRRTALASVHPSGSLGRFKTAVIVPRAAHPGRSRILVAPAAPLPVLVVGRG